MNWEHFDKLSALLGTGIFTQHSALRKALIKLIERKNQ
jgi:hypothetical protein